MRTQGCHSETHQLLEGDLHRSETASSLAGAELAHVGAVEGA
jgi:hypothetical protein